MNNSCDGFTSYFKPSCYIESWSSAAIKGAVSGAANGLGPAAAKTISEGSNAIGTAIGGSLQSAFNSTDFSNIGGKLGSFTAKQATDFFSSPEIQQLFQSANMGSRLGSFTAKQATDFFSSPEIQQMFQSANMGSRLGSFTAKETTDFFSSPEMQQMFQSADIGNKLGSSLNKESANFFASLNFDAAASSGKVGQTIEQSYEQLIKNLNFQKIGRTSGDAFEDAWNGLDFTGRAQTVGSDIKDSMDVFTQEIGEGVQKAVGNTMTGVRNEVVYNQMPHFLAAAAVATSIIVGTPLALLYLYYKAKNRIGRPKLATDVKQIGLLTRVKQAIVNRIPFRKTNKVKAVFNEELSRRFNEISNGIQNTRENGGYFQHMLVYGPGGTGKTMISHEISEKVGMSYIKMSGGDLAQYIKRGEHVSELNKLIDKMEKRWRPWSTRPWVLFIDEAESLCKNRDDIQVPELLELQNALLNRTGTETKKFMLILATNRMEDLDEAILTRVPNKIYVGPPDQPTRAKIIRSHLPTFFSQAEQDEFFTDEVIEMIAQKTDKFVGRGLFGLLNEISNRKASTKSNQLTREMMEQTVEDFVVQEKQVLQRRLEKEKKKLLKQGVVQQVISPNDILA